MSIGNEIAILSTKLKRSKTMQYFWYQRNQQFQTIHSTRNTPWEMIGNQQISPIMYTQSFGRISWKYL